MAEISQKEMGEALQSIAEHLHFLGDRLAKLEAGLHAVKGMLALQMNPSAPKHALKRIQDLEASILKRDPNAAARKQVAEVLEMLKIFDKHGGPKQA